MDPPARPPTADATVFAAFYRDHFALVWRGLKRLGVAIGDCDDAAQEVFVAAHRRWSAFDGAVARRTWVLGIVRRIAWRWRRGDRRRMRRLHAIASIDAPVASLDDAIARAEAGRALAAFLDDLDPDKREAFVLGELEEIGRVELGRILGVNPYTAYSRLQAARRRFFAHFAQLDDDACAKLLVAAEHHDTPSESRRASGWAALTPILAAPVSGLLASAGSGKVIGIAIGAALIVGITIDVASSLESVASSRTQPIVTSASAAPIVTVAPALPPSVPPSSVPIESPQDAVTEARPSSGRVATPRASAGDDALVAADLQAQLAMLRSARAATLAGDLVTARRRLAEFDARFGEVEQLVELRAGIDRDIDRLVLRSPSSGDEGDR